MDLRVAGAASSSSRLAMTESASARHCSPSFLNRLVRRLFSTYALSENTHEQQSSNYITTSFECRQLRPLLAQPNDWHKISGRENRKNKAESNRKVRTRSPLRRADNNDHIHWKRLPLRIHINLAPTNILVYFIFLSRIRLFVAIHRLSVACASTAHSELIHCFHFGFQFDTRSRRRWRCAGKDGGRRLSSTPNGCTTEIGFNLLPRDGRNENVEPRETLQNN